jgi:nucleotide-binding universal stress UspA family protein
MNMREERVEMSVVVAHQRSATSRLILQEAAKEASRRQTSLSVIHVAEGVDIDLIEEQEVSLRAEIADVLGEAKVTDVEWTLTVATGVDVADTVCDVVAGTDVELLVIGARHRSPVGKLIMGSVTQSIILRAEVPVLVVKAPTRT